MKLVDRILQEMRFKQAVKYIPNKSTLLDIGALNGELFDFLGDSLEEGVGYDNANTQTIKKDNYSIHPNTFPDSNINGQQFDAAVLLAVFEHIPPEVQVEMVANLRKHLKPSGKVIITVPSPLVDLILPVLNFFHLIDHDEFSIHQHYGFKPKDLIPLFESNNFSLHKRKLFQLGLNNLFVFTKQE